MRRFLAVVLGTVVALAVVEGGVRVFAPQTQSLTETGGAGLLRGPLTTPGDHRVRNPEYDVTVHVNAAGFVDREWPAVEARDNAGGGVAGGATPPPQEEEIVVIGDSFVQAAQVRPGEGFGARLEAGLRARGKAVDVLSMGVPGAGTATALGVLREYALPRKPDLVVLGFLVSNDVLNNHPLLEGKDDKPFYTVRDGQLTPVKAVDLVVRSPMWQWSALWRYATRAQAYREVAARKLALGQGMPIDLRVHDPACMGAGTGPHCDAWGEAWAVTDALIAEMKRACGDVPFAVVLFPDRVQVERTTEWPGAAGWDFDAAQNRAAKVAETHAPTLDLLPGMRAAGGDLYLRKDGHWTPRGHAAAAELTVPFVEGLLAR